MNIPILSKEKTDSLLLEAGQGESVSLGSLWAEKPAALFFVRHFG